MLSVGGLLSYSKYTISNFKVHMFLISVIKAIERKRECNKQCENVMRMDFTIYNIYCVWEPNRFAIYGQLVADGHKTFVYVLIRCIRL